MPGKYKGKSTKLGEGGRFEKLKDSLKKEGKTEEAAEKIAAAIGRKKYGKKKMATMAAKGKEK